MTRLVVHLARICRLKNPALSSPSYANDATPGGSVTPEIVAEYEKQKAEAREAKRKLWADPDPELPWKWRKSVYATPSRFESDLLCMFGDHMTGYFIVRGRRDDFLGPQLRLLCVGPTGNDLVRIGITNTGQGHQLLLGG